MLWDCFFLPQGMTIAKQETVQRHSGCDVRLESYFVEQITSYSYLEIKCITWFGEHARPCRAETIEHTNTCIPDNLCQTTKGRFGASTMNILSQSWRGDACEVSRVINIADDW